MKLFLNDIVKVTSGKVRGDLKSPLTGVSIDTRTLREGDLFVAIKGAHFDGHDFISEAVAGGAAAVVVRKGSSVSGNVVSIEVSDTERALGDIASFWRSKFTCPCVAITGSNGKSTTKEMIAAICPDPGKVLKTEGNFNNTIGLPLTIFRWRDEHDFAILEMGMNAPGEIKRLAEISRPDVGIITNVTSAHLAKLHSVEAVASAKGELFEAMGSYGIAVVNLEDKLVRKVAELHSGKKITFGMRNECDVRFLNVETNGLDSTLLSVSVFGKELKVALPVPGAHNVMNAMAALAVGSALKINPEISAERIGLFKPMPMRFERIQLANGVRVVNDSYNANPESMRVAFRTVGSAKRAGRFIAVVGDMLELGDASATLHRQLGKDAVAMGVERLFVTGEFSGEVSKGANDSGLDPSLVTIFSDPKEIESKLISEISAGDVVLVKGSRGMKMERVVEALKNKIGMG